MVMDSSFFLNVFQLGLEALRTAYGKVFEDILTNSLKDLSAVSPEYEPLASCLLEIIKTGSIKIECLPEKDEDYLNEMISKIMDSDHFTRYCDSAIYTDAKLKEGLNKFFVMFENNITKDQKLFNKLQLEYDRKLLQTRRKTEENTGEMKNQISAMEHKLDKTLALVPSKENVKANGLLDPEGYKSKYLESLFSLAFELGNNRKYGKALRKYKEFIKEKDSNLHRKYFVVLNNMAATYLGLRNHKKALEYADKAHQIAPKRSLAVLNLAVACFYLRKLDQALEYAQKARRKRIDDPNVYNTLSIIYAEKGDQRKAYQFINKAIKKGEEFAPAYVNRAILYAQMQKYEEALCDLSKAIELDPQNGEFFVVVGVVYQRKLSSMMQSEVVPIGLKGEIHYINYEKLNNLTDEQIELREKAIDNYEKAVKLHVKIQDNPTLGVHLADCYLMKKRYKEAEKIYKEIKVKHEKEYPYQCLGDVYFWTGRFKKALACYRKFLVLHGENPHAYNWIARTLTELKDFDGAIENLQKAIELDLKNPRFKFNLGLIYEMRNRLKEAQAIFEELKQLDFDLGNVCLHLGKIYFWQQMYGSAKLEFLEAKMAGMPRELFSEFLAFSAGATAGLTKDTNVAKEEFKYLLSKDPENFIYNFNYARILDLEGNRELAKPHYIKALTLKEIKKYPSLSMWIPRRLYEIDMAKSKIIIPRSRI
jgi:tetratricopeptide (TPR) repeat protein